MTEIGKRPQIDTRFDSESNQLREAFSTERPEVGKEREIEARLLVGAVDYLDRAYSSHDDPIRAMDNVEYGLLLLRRVMVLQGQRDPKMGKEILRALDYDLENWRNPSGFEADELGRHMGLVPELGAEVAEPPLPSPEPPSQS